MVKKRWISVCLVVLLICGCDIVSENSASSNVPTLETTAPTAVTVPAAVSSEPTLDVPPPSTTQPQPQLPVVEGQLVEITQSIPSCDTATTQSMVVCEPNDYGFVAYYAHLPSKAAASQYPYQNGLFWVLEPDELENSPGWNHYDLYTPNSGMLEKVKECSFKQSYTVLEETVILELDYAQIMDQAVVTYVPENSAESGTAMVVDLSRGTAEALVMFNLKAGVYYAAVNLETGVMTDFLEGVGVIPGGLGFYPRLQCAWLEDNSLILTDGLQWLYVDAVNKEIREYMPDESATDPLEFAVNSDGTVFVTDAADGETVVVKLPEDWIGRAWLWTQSEDMRKAICVDRVENGAYQMLIFDADSNTLYSVQRTNAAWTEYEVPKWLPGNALYIASEDRKDICVFDFGIESAE